MDFLHKQEAPSNKYWEKRSYTKGVIFSEAVTQPLMIHTVVKATCFLLTSSIWQLSNGIFSGIVVNSYIFRRISLSQTCKNYIFYT